MVIKTSFGMLDSQTEVFQYTLKNHNGVSASFLDMGAIWTSMIVPDRSGKMGDVLLGYDTVRAYRENGGHLGEIVGRSANRIAGASFALNGKTYRLEANNGRNNLHSGTDFYRDRIWKADYSEEGNSVSFSLESPDGDQGYPGNASICVTYTLTDENELEIHYEASCDQDTVMNLTNHAYFNLAGHGSGPAMDQKVFLDSDVITAADAESIPTGELRDVTGTPMDFRQMKPIRQEIDADYDQLNFAGGYDHNWVLNHEPGGFGLSAKAWDEASGRMMEVYTDLPGMQFYTGNGLSSVIPGKDGVLYGRREGYCFETQYYPNAVNMPQFPSPVLKKGETYDSVTIYKFLVR